MYALATAGQSKPDGSKKIWLGGVQGGETENGWDIPVTVKTINTKYEEPLLAVSYCAALRITGSCYKKEHKFFSGAESGLDR